MKNKKLLTGCVLLTSSVAAVAAVVLSTIGPSALLKVSGELGPNEYYHYAGVQETCETAGIKEYYTNCNGITSLTLPDGGTVKEERVLTDAQIKSILANPTDERVVAAKGHNFDDINGECVKNETVLTTDVFNVHGQNATLGISSLTETEDEAGNGLGKIYKYSHTYNNDAAWSISKMFNDFSLEDVETFEFFIDTKGAGTFMFADDANTTSSGYEIHPNAGGGTAGYIKGIQTSPGTWKITTTGFKLRNMNDGALVTEYTCTGKNTLNELFHRPTGGWGCDTVYVSAVKLTSLTKCGAVKLNNYLLMDPSLFKDDAGDCEFGKMHSYTSSMKNFLDSTLNISGYDKIKFRINNPDGNNTFILKGNTSSCVGGIYGGANGEDVIVATKNGSDWTVKRESGKNFFELPSWAGAASYTVNNATQWRNLFDFFTYSSQVTISDIVGYGSPAETRKIETLTALDLYTNNGTKGCATITETGAIEGFGKKYTYAHTYNDGVAWGISNMFADYSLTGVKRVEFYIDCMGSEFMFAGDDNTTSTSFELHPSAGAQTPGYMRAVQTEPGTWTVYAYGFNFRNMSTGAQVPFFTFTNRNTLNELFHRPSGGWGANKVTVSDIIVVR